MDFVEFFISPFIFIFHSALFPQKSYALSRNDYYTLITRNLLFAFQMLIVFMVFYSKLAFLISLYICIFGIIRNIICAFLSKAQPHLLLVTSKIRKEMNLNGVKVEFLLEEGEKLNFDLFKKVMTFESFDAVILSNVSDENRKLISDSFSKKIKVFNY